MARARIQKLILVVGTLLLGVGFLLAVQKPGIVPFSVSFSVMVAGGLCLVVWLAFLVPTTKNNCCDTNIPRDKQDEQSKKEEKTK